MKPPNVKAGSICCHGLELPGALPDTLPQNPSYYAPSHFRTFYEVSGDKRWLELAGYRLLPDRTSSGILQRSQRVRTRAGLVRRRSAGEHSTASRKIVDLRLGVGQGFPLRVAADYQISGDSRKHGRSSALRCVFRP